MGVPDSCLSVAAAAVSRSSAKLVRAPIVCCARAFLKRAGSCALFQARATLRRLGPAAALFRAMRGGSRALGAAVEAAARVWRSPERRVSPSTQARRENTSL